MTAQTRLTTTINQFTLFFFFFVGGLAASRILYEWLFPRFLWLGHPLGAFPLAIAAAFLGWLIFTKYLHENSLFLAPLALNFIYLMQPAVDVIESRFVFFASIWLTVLLYTYRNIGHRPKLGFLLVLLALIPIFLLTTSHQVGRDDTFEFQVVAPNLGIVHPTGYPLYLILGKLFTFLPFGSIAWRLNLASIFYVSTAACGLYWVLQRWWQRPLPAILTAVVTALAPTLWSQAIVAEVYSLHFLVVVTILGLLARIGGWGVFSDQFEQKHLILLAFVFGLGMTNHVTTIILLPPALLTLLFAHQKDPPWRFKESPAAGTPSRILLAHLLKPIVAGLLPLSLYVYLPLRWRAVNQEPMGLDRFIDWVIGGRFQGALQLRAWLDDPTRYEIVGRLFLDNWGWFNLILAVLGLGLLLYSERQTAVILLLVLGGYTFYCLNYYVPDLAVFLIPAQVIIGIFWGAAIKTGLDLAKWRLNFREGRMKLGTGLMLYPLALLPFLIPALTHGIENWSRIDQSKDDGRTQWGTAVLSQPLLPNSAILADSDKFPPLFYLQQSEKIRPDLDISVWPDESAYREQLNQRLHAGQPVYLARFLPGLEAGYHLNSQGPLIHVTTEPQTTLPPGTTPATLVFADHINLIGFNLQPMANTLPNTTAVTFFWQAETAVDEVLHVYVRWAGFEASAGQHPANNFYPTVAWKGDEIVADYHEFRYPLLSEPQTLELQAALGPPFATADELAWQTVTTTRLEPLLPPATTLVRARLGQFVVDGIVAPGRARPGNPITVAATGWGDKTSTNLRLQSDLSNELPINLIPPTIDADVSHQQILIKTFDQLFVNGRYHLAASHPDGLSCGWMQPLAASCVLTTILIDGVPLPEGAINFEDKIGLLKVEIAQTELTPGGSLDLILNWQALAPIDENYTAFVQLLSQNDQIMTQIDSWPLQGTYPTSQWQAGEIITDPYTLALPAEMPPGVYKIQVGFYLLETLRRLPTVDANGRHMGDTFTIEGLFLSDS